MKLNTLIGYLVYQNDDLHACYEGESTDCMRMMKPNNILNQIYSSFMFNFRQRPKKENVNKQQMNEIIVFLELLISYSIYLTWSSWSVWILNPTSTFTFERLTHKNYNQLFFLNFKFLK